jgi:hypothetical protein
MNFKKFADRAAKVLDEKVQPMIDKAKAEGAEDISTLAGLADEALARAKKGLQDFAAPEAPAEDATPAPKKGGDKGNTDGPKLGKPDMNSKYEVLKDFFGDEGMPGPDDASAEKPATPKTRKPRAPKNKPGA